MCDSATDMATTATTTARTTAVAATVVTSESANEMRSLLLPLESYAFSGMSLMHFERQHILQRTCCDGVPVAAVVGDEGMRTAATTTGTATTATASITTATTTTPAATAASTSTHNHVSEATSSSTWRLCWRRNVPLYAEEYSDGTEAEAAELLMNLV